MTENRNANVSTSGGNYNESIGGNYIGSVSRDYSDNTQHIGRDYINASHVTISDNTQHIGGDCFKDSRVTIFKNPNPAYNATDLAQELSLGAVDGYSVDILVKTALIPTKKTAVIDYLVKALNASLDDPGSDPTERHWIYTALGKIPDLQVQPVLKRGLSDENEFARLGAQRALELFRVNRPG